MRRRLTIAAFAVLLLALGVSLMCLARAKVRIRQAALEDATDEMLDRRLPEVNFDNTPLDAAIETLRNEAHANIVVHWKMLENHGIDRKAPVSLHLRDARLSVVLRHLLDEVDNGGFKLKCQAIDSVIILSTREDWGRNVVFRMYDVTDLLALSHEEQLRAVEEREVARGGGTLPGRDDSRTDPYIVTVHEQVDELVRLIEDTLDSDSWDQYGGSIREWSGCLLVRATPQSQREIAALLQQLRDSFQRGVPYQSHSATRPSN